MPDKVAAKVTEKEKRFWGGHEKMETKTLAGGTMILQYGWCLPEDHDRKLAGVRAALGVYPDSVRLSQ